MFHRSDLVKHSCPLLVNEIIRELHLVDRVNSSKHDQDVLLPGIFLKTRGENKMENIIAKLNLRPRKW